jgi:membrane-associated phospholipid phosphatase
MLTTIRTCALLAPTAFAGFAAEGFAEVLALDGPRPRPAPVAEVGPADAEAGGQVWFGSRVVSDTWGLVAAPLDWSGRDWAVAGGAVVATVATGLWLDRSFQSESQENRNPDKDRWSGAWGQLGTIYSFVVLGAAGGYGWLADDPRGVDVMVDGLEASVIASGILCPLLKYSVGRARPYQTAQDNDVFDPFGGGMSFPSGHTTQAFTVAAVVACTYDEHPLVGGVAFAAAAGVGLSRINSDAHYASDVLAGAILGTWVGYEVVRANRARRGGAPRATAGFSWDLQLASDRQGITATWRW